LLCREFYHNSPNDPSLFRWRVDVVARTIDVIATCVYSIGLFRRRTIQSLFAERIRLSDVVPRAGRRKKQINHFHVSCRYAALFFEVCIFLVKHNIISIAFRKNLLGVWVSVAKNNIGWFASSFLHTCFSSRILTDIVKAEKSWFFLFCLSESTNYAFTSTFVFS